MAKRLTDKTRKKIAADLIEGASIRELARKYAVSTTTIFSIKHAYPELQQKLTQKKEQNTAEVLRHMDKKKNEVCALIDKLLCAIGDDEKIKAAPISQLATTMGILIDKYTAHETPAAENQTEVRIIDDI